MLVRSRGIPVTPAFVPMELTLTFQSQKEIDGFYHLFNHPLLCSYLREHGIKPEQVRDAIPSGCGYDSYRKLHETLK
jgi:hypothetical protein